MNWKLEKRSISDVKVFDKNPRRITEKGLKDLGISIDKFGLAEPIVINTDGTIIGGHARYLSLKKKGIKEFDCYIPDRELTEQELKELNVRLNKNIAGEFDFDILANEFELGDLLEWGFEEKELDINLWKEEIPEEKLDEVPEPQKEAYSKLGDIFLLDGKHRVMCGDSTKEEEFKILMDGKKANITFTSPPYNADSLNIKNQKGTQKKYHSVDDNKTETEYLDFIKTNLEILHKFSEEVFYNIGLVENNKRVIIKVLSLFEDTFKDFIYWKKNTVAPHIQKGVINNLVEFIICFGDGRRKFKNASFQGTYWNVIEGANASKNEYSDIHKATFPIYLPLNIIKNFSNINSIIIDCFLGTGTTLIASDQINRICYGMELDPIYIDVILRRYHNLYPDKKIECLTREFNLDELWQDLKNK